MLNENLSINITPNGVPLVIHISQYDVGLRTFIFTPYTSSGTFTPDTAVSATLEGTKPDGNIVIHNCEYDSATGQIIYTIQEQLAAVAGRVWSKIVLRDTYGNAIGYTAIVWLVDMAGVADGAVASDSDISALAEFIKEFGTINAYKSALDGAIAAVGGPNVASTVAQMTDRTKVYVYTGSQSGYTAGHWYYWNGSAWTDGGVYQATAVETDKTLAVTDMAADAKATGDAVTELKNDLDVISQIAENLFDPSYLLTATGWAYSSVDGAYYGTYRYLCAKFGTNTDGYPISFDSGVQYKLSGTYKVSGDTTTGNGVSFRFHYTDTTTSDIKLPNSTSEYTDFEVTSEPGKTIEKLSINYTAGPNNIIYLKNMAVYPNNAFPATAKDLVARADISAQNTRMDDIEDNIDAIESSIKNSENISADSYTPAGFTWTDNPISGKISDDFRGNVKVDFDVSAYDPSGNGVTYYVDAVNGLDANDGLTPATALAKISTAYAKPDVSCIILEEGIYIAVKNLYQQVIGKSIAIKGEPGKDVYICQTSLTTLSEVEGYSGVYSGARGNCAGVMDLKNKNADGDGTLYINASTLEEVQTTEGTWILTGGTIYIHTINGRVPDSDLLMFRSGDNLVAAGSLTLYLENLKVYGGNSPLRATATAESDHLRVFAKDCEFYYSYTEDNDAVMMQGAEIAIFQNCAAKYAKKDGFNYHMAQNILPKAIEIGCVGAYNGNTEDNNDQGSTIHDGGSAIRVNCFYHDNIGSNVADQGEGTEAWMIGCVAYKSLAEGGQNSNYFTYDDVHHWLQSCVGFGSSTNVHKHNEDSIVALRNCRFEGKLAIEGQEVEYY